ncbi:PLDc N-terminal domain-containing protein [Lentiprolixibacter aurantiacus]|uniref:PLDc N-terminal domain-containing protein n=1 Tax=Lentiprolixibacter aurantiacus TaxID=2993939 RepID=A0AAE3SP62_9FLAO|nr:PLDc N-terminal domain-containing protein [Lentiprolixibacter aurantiacus]MCX2720270.1 PLDc N-terminal domain-containing protein [Lentiprolixibacter aurantiacus]
MLLPLALSSAVIFFVLILALFALVLTLVALVDILGNKFEGNDKLIWVLVVIFLGIIGVFLYFAMGQKQKLPKP